MPQEEVTQRGSVSHKLTIVSFSRLSKELRGLRGQGRKARPPPSTLIIKGLFMKVASEVTGMPVTLNINIYGAGSECWEEVGRGHLSTCCCDASYYQGLMHSGTSGGGC